MAEPAKKKKTTVRVETSAPAKSSDGGDGGKTWTPTPEAKSKATTNRIVAGILWLLAIGTEVFAILWLLRQVPFQDWHWWLLIGLLVVIGALALIGSLLWKKANRLDPASRKDAFRFFVQNQLGVIITIIAFLPLIILIFMNKEMDGKQKGIAGAIAIVLAVGVGLIAADWNPVSQEDYATDRDAVIFLTGKDEVTWTKSGGVYHLCEEASAVNRESQDGQIFVGTVQAAVEAGKTRLTKQLAQEVRECGLDPDRLTQWENQQVTPEAPDEEGTEDETDE